MRSSWDETKVKSQYHFDNDLIDPRFDTVVQLGQFLPCWGDELDKIINTAQPAQWANRGYKGRDEQAPPEDLAAEEYDMSRVGMDPKMTITHLNWDLPVVLQRISDLFGLDDCMNRIHVQQPGELWNLHLDKLQKWCPEDPSRIMRIMIQLTDWQPGQFWEYGNYHHRGWKAGEVTTFDWANVPHSTANAGHHPRVTLQITGVVTEKTRDFLRILRSKSPYRLSGT
jgi:hypothetical protein